jgi:hypothetical protein
MTIIYNMFRTWCPVFIFLGLAFLGPEISAEDQSCIPYQESPWIQRKSIVLNDKTFAEGKLRIYPGVMILELYGSNYQMGYQHGAMLRYEIEDIIEIQKDSAKKSNRQVSLETVRAAITYKKTWPKWAKEEIQGISDGSEIPVADIVWLNIYHQDILKTPKEKDNWMPDYGIAFFHKEGQYKVAGIIKPGMVGIFSGVNEKGCILTNLEDDKKTSSDRINLLFTLGTGMCDVSRSDLENGFTISGDIISIISNKSSWLLCVNNETAQKGSVDFVSEDYYKKCPACVLKKSDGIEETNIE